MTPLLRFDFRRLELNGVHCDTVSQSALHCCTYLEALSVG